MADHIDLDDCEYTSPPGELPPLTGPQIVGMRLDSIEQRLAWLERGRGDTGRQLVDMEESIRVAIDAMVYLSGAIDNMRAQLMASETL